MKQFSKQFHTKSKAVHLSAAEREELRERVVSYMEYHPLLHKEKKIAHNYSSELATYKTIRIPFTLLTRWAMVTSVFLLVTIPAMAERSVPGDSLYAVKVNFNEELISTLTVNPFKKVEWETERLNRRIAEARLLATTGRLTEAVEAEIAEAVKQHAGDAAREIEKLRETDADSATLASIELGSTLALQSSSLQSDTTDSTVIAVADEAPETASKLLEVINESLSLNGQQEDAAAIPPYDKITARVEINTTRAYELLTSLEPSVDNKVYRDINRRLDDIARSIEGANALRAQDEALASEELVGVLQRTQKLIVFMTGPLKDTTDIETIVPMILTTEEKTLALQELRKNISEMTQLLQLSLAEADAATQEKALYVLTKVEVHESTIANTEDLSAALTLANESKVLLEETVKMLENEGVSLRRDDAASEQEAIEGEGLINIDAAEQLPIEEDGISTTTQPEV